jgi:hypothetical protein
MATVASAVFGFDTYFDLESESTDELKNNIGRLGKESKRWALSTRKTSHVFEAWF